MKSFDGYLKKKLGDNYVLLAGGGEKSLDEIVWGASYGTNLQASFNCNSVSKTEFITTGSFTNKPSGVRDWGSLLNIRLYSDNNLYHRLLFFDCYNSDKIWTRSDSNGTWTDWVQLLTTKDWKTATGFDPDDYFKRSGDTIKTGGYIRFADASLELASYDSRLCLATNGQVTAMGASVGSLLVSSAWSHSSNVPSNGIWSKGDIKTNSSLYSAVDANITRDVSVGRNLAVTGTSTFTGDLYSNGQTFLKCGYFYSSNPSLGNLLNGTVVINASLSNGARCTYGLFIWDDYVDGTAKLLSGYCNNSSSSPLGLALQPLGGKVGIGYSGDVRQLAKTLLINGSVGATSDIVSEGKVGIGTTSPDVTLHLYTVSTSATSNETNIKLISDGPGGDVAAIYELKGSGNGFTFAETNRDFIWRVGEGSITAGGGTEIMRLAHNGTLTAAKFVKSGGTSSQFLMADGSTNSNSYHPYEGNYTTVMRAKVLRTNANNNGEGYGLSLYGNYQESDNSPFYGIPMYGIYFGKTSNFGNHGYTTSWNTYFTLRDTYGWVFQNHNSTTLTNVASISYAGKLYLNDGADITGVLRNCLSSDPQSAGKEVAKFLSYSPSPFGIVITGYGSGTHSILVKREANTTELYTLSLNPLGGDVLANGYKVLTTANTFFGTSPDTNGNVSGKAIFYNTTQYWQSGPSLGHLNTGTVEFRGIYNGSPTSYGVFYWNEPWSGNGCFQSGYTNGSGSPLHITFLPLGGNVGIGTSVSTIPSYKLHVVGDVGATNFYTTSDRSKKQNISSFSEHIRKFQLKDTEKWHYGVIALEVEEMFRDGEEGNMTVNYNSILSYYVGLLENRVKELEEKINKLENK